MNTMRQEGRKRVAVLGGGIAGLTAAYELADRGDYDITVYQMGWRLGGKLASSRNPDRGMRIEEHGIHVLFGAYENAFHVLRRAYEDLGRNWADAFVERNDFTLMENVKREWIPWTVGLPRNEGNPGDSLHNGTRSSSEVPKLTADMIGWLRDRIFDHFEGTKLERPAKWFFGRSLGRTGATADRIIERVDAGEASKREKRRLLRQLRLNLFILRVVGWIGHIVWTVLYPFIGDEVGRINGVRRLWIMAELGVASTAGLTRAALDNRGRLELDELDLTQWLRRNGVFGAGISRTSANSAPLRMVYEVVFGYDGGDPSKPRLAAGTAIRDLLRLLFDRRGALAYAMKAGSAETIITPLYQALKKKGVRFEFFHRIDRLDLSPDRKHVERIHFTRQMTPKTGEYDPLIRHGAWPHEPKYDLLENGEALRRILREDRALDLETPDFDPQGATRGTLERGHEEEGFDLVVLAIPVDALRPICKPLAEVNERWRDMLEHARTTATHSVQLWFDRTAEELGWQYHKTDEPALLGGYAQPFGNWVDLSITLAAEDWSSAPVQPKSVAYLCGPLIEGGIPRAGRKVQDDSVRRECETWLSAHGPHLWRKVFGKQGFEWARLVAPPDVRDAKRYEAQFFRANTNPSDRYTLTLPGTTRYRLAPGDSGFENLYLAGDWTANGFDVGAVEATVMSGRLAARAVLGLDESTMPIYGEVQENRPDRPVSPA